MSKGPGLIILQVLLVVAFALALNAFNKSVSPERSQVQKVYDDFVVELQKQALNAPSENSIGQDTASKADLPEASLEFNLKADRESKFFKYTLDWNKPDQVKKALRIFELLKLGNVFSGAHAPSPSVSSVAITVLSASGYKFESKLSADELNNSSPLRMAWALMQELNSEQGVLR